MPNLNFNQPTHRKQRNRYPIRWLEVVRETGCIYAEYSGTERPRSRSEANAIVPAKPGE